MPTQDTGASNAQYWIDRLLAGGRSPTGSTGLNVSNHIGRYAGLGGTYTSPDPSTFAYGSWSPFGGSEAGSDTMNFNPSGAYADLGNRGLVQVANDDGSLPNDGRIIDYSRLTYDPVWGILSPQDNIHLDSRAGDLTFALGALGLGGMVAPAIFGSTPVDLGIGGGLDPETIALNSGTGAATGSVPDSYWGMVADNGGATATDATVADSGGLFSQNLGPGGGLDPETWAGNGGMGVAQNGIGPGTWGDIVRGTINNPGSVVGRAGLGNLGSWAISHPLQAYGAGQTIAGLLNHGGGSNGGSSGTSNKGGTGTGVNTGFNAERPAYTPNPYLVQQLRQAGYQI